MGNYNRFLDRGELLYKIAARDYSYVIIVTMDFYNSDTGLLDA